MPRDDWTSTSSKAHRSSASQAPKPQEYSEMPGEAETSWRASSGAGSLHWDPLSSSIQTVAPDTSHLINQAPPESLESWDGWSSEEFIPESFDVEYQHQRKGTIYYSLAGHLQLQSLGFTAKPLAERQHQKAQQTQVTSGRSSILFKKYEDNILTQF